MSSNPVTIKTISDQQIQNRSYYCQLNLNNHLSDIRKELRKYNIIDDTLLFLKKINNEFAEIVRETEKEIQLKEILEFKNEGSKSYYLYLMKDSSPNWNILNDKFNLDYGCTMSFDGIKKADKRAFIMRSCKLTKIVSEYSSGSFKFESKEDWINKKNLFINIDGVNVHNIVKFGLSVGISKNETFNEEINSTYSYTEVSKVSLKFSEENLEPTSEFINDVNDAIKAKNSREKFSEIIEKYGQFIPMEITLGGRVYFKDDKIASENSVEKSKEGSISTNIDPSTIKIGGNFNDTNKKSTLHSSGGTRILGGTHPESENFIRNDWIKSLNDYQTWDCIEYKNPTSIFRILPKNIREESFKFIGKRILYISTHDCIYDLYKPGVCKKLVLKDIECISKIINNKDAECDVFAAVIDIEDSKDICFSCQIVIDSELNDRPVGPCVLINSIQKIFKKWKYNLVIKLLIVGYDTEFLENTSVELIKYAYNPKDNEFGESGIITLKNRYNDLLERNVPFFGIPILINIESNNSLIIGHDFRKLDNEFIINTFSYCSKTHRYVKLPEFTFCTFIILDNNTSNIYELLPFKFKRRLNYKLEIERSPFIDLTKSFTSQSPRWHKNVKVSKEDNAICMVFEIMN
ncbi:hypothetical protein C1645_828006 [Glomus cerebriforme]|uniref:Uncharacterized protein n=1 Tax=Glomus cerebriforme TaxID=658196 RepID=A0A397SMN8_9GLOM|nr:hypothetical protein C1645_828006 [Glomus cerebriforme]